MLTASRKGFGEGSELGAEFGFGEGSELGAESGFGEGSELGAEFGFGEGSELGAEFGFGEGSELGAEFDSVAPLFEGAGLGALLSACAWAFGFASVREKKKITRVPARIRTSQRHKSGNCFIAVINL